MQFFTFRYSFLKNCPYNLYFEKSSASKQATYQKASKKGGFLFKEIEKS